MNTQRYLSTLLLLVVATSHVAANDNDLYTDTLQVCADNAGWPPYTYEYNNRVVGYDIDVLTLILQPDAIHYNVTLLPWARCLHLVQLGEYHIVLSASFNEERARNYHMTQPYYTVQPSYIYNSKRFPDGLNITQPKDLLNYKVCGLQGYNYLPFGIQSTLVDRETRTFGQVVQKTLANRCDVFLARYEVLGGFAQLGENYLRDGLVAVAVPTIAAEPFYMLISRAYPYATALVEQLNTGIESLAKDGQLDRLLADYLTRTTTANASRKDLSPSAAAARK